MAPELSRWYEAWAAVPLHWMLVSLMMFSFRLCRLRFVRLERAVLVITAAWTLLLLASPVTWPFNLGYAWLTVLWLATIAFVALQYVRTPRLELLLVLALAVAHALGGLDMLMQLGLRDSDSRIYLTPYSLLLFALVMGTNLVDTFSRARATQERLNQELDQRLAARESEIAVEHARVLQLQREQAAATERERIMRELRELRDGLGANLITSMQAAEAGTLQVPELAAMLRECVDDLRLALDSLRPSGNELLPVLGNLRYRMQPRLASAGVRLDWWLSPEATSPVLSPDQVLHTLRIVQEAIANALKHASPKSIGGRYETLAHGG